MSHVQIDNFQCEMCDKVGFANLDIKANTYTCLHCNHVYGGKE